MRILLNAYKWNFAKSECECTQIRTKTYGIVQAKNEPFVASAFKINVIF